MIWKKSRVLSKPSVPSALIVCATNHQKSGSALVRIVRFIRIGWVITRTDRELGASLSRKKKPMDSVKIVGGHGDRRERDFYPTPPDCTEALLNYLGVRPKPLGKAWECAAGDGHISRVLRRYGYEVIESDIQTGTDFLTADLPHGAEWIITNPPFNLAEAFIRKALSFNVPVALLLKSQFWHSKKRYPLFCSAPPIFSLASDMEAGLYGARRVTSRHDVVCVGSRVRGWRNTLQAARKTIV